ncbi:MAG TPA: hypothetical protein VI547_08335 [Anaerolineales bacterium]|nr:hypothetical protein [Anaerolineales bacterium]
MNRTTAIIVTVVTAVFCGCPGLGTCFWGVYSAITSAMLTSDLGGDPTMAIVTGVGSVCGGIILIAIPIVVGVLTLRNAKQA